MSKLWTYKGALKKYPVQTGDTWVVGKHRLICGDLEGETNLYKELEQYPADLMYVDPPWNNQIASAFREKSGVDGEAPRKVEVSKLICTIIKIAKDRKLLLFMEGGNKMRQMNRDCIDYVGSPKVKEWTITYTDRAIPCALWAIDFREEPKDDYPNLEGLSEFEVETLVMSHYKPNRVLDTCGGLGGTAWGAERTGCGSITHELSPYKMAEAIKLLHKLTGEIPKKV